MTDVLAKTAEPIEMPFGRLTLVGPRCHALNGSRSANRFAAARVDKSAMRPLPHYFGNFLSTLFSTSTPTRIYRNRNNRYRFVMAVDVE